MSEKADTDPAGKLLEIIAKYSGAADIRGDSRLMADLRLDSFDLVNIAMDAGESLGIAVSPNVLPAFKTVNDIFDYARASLRRAAANGGECDGKGAADA